MVRGLVLDEFGGIGARVLRAVVLLVLVCAVAGCGLSSNSSSTSTPTPTPTPTPDDNDDDDDEPNDYDTKLAGYEASPEYSPSYIISGTLYTDRHLSRIKAAPAYARDATGKDVTVTIVDTGINTEHREFAGSGKLTVQSGANGYVPGRSDLFHGTAVAAAAAGNRDGGDNLNMHGVAFDATIDFIPIRLGSGEGAPADPEPLDDFTPEEDQANANSFSWYLSRAKGDIVNFSWGVGAPVTFTPSKIRETMSITARVFEQRGVAAANKKIITWSAGNDGYARPSVFAGLGAGFSELQSIIVVVAALDQDGTIAGYSNRCGISKNNCIAAPGTRILTAFNYYDPPTVFTDNDDYRHLNGTSFAAPIVAGSLAVMKQFFRSQLGNTELVDRLFATADRSGIYANSDIYGQGLVDLDNATKPQGMVITGLPGDKDAVPLSQTGFTLTGNAFGASFAELSRIEISGFDELGAPFFFPATSLIAHTARDTAPTPTKLSATLPEGELALRADAHGATQSGYLQHNNYLLAYGENPAQFFGNATTRDNVNDAFNFADNDHRFNHINIGFDNNNAFVSPYLSLAQNGTSAGWRNDNGRFGFAFMQGNAHFDQWQDNGGERGLGLLMDWTTLTKHGAIALQAGAVRETDSLLGARANQSDLSAQTLFAGINIAHRFGDWQTLASAYFGNTEPTARNAYWQLDDTIKSGAFAFAASRQSWQNQHDQLTIRLTQPLRTERAQATLNMPAGRTKYGEVIHQQHDIDLSPNGRTLQLEAAYQTPVAITNKSDSTVQTAIGVERHPMHDAARDSRWYVRLGVETRF